jgi:methyl-accepting chemotaxis protein
MKIRAKLTVGMLSISLTGMILLTCVSYYIARSIIVDETLRATKELVGSKAGKIDGWLGFNKGVAIAVGLTLNTLENKDEYSSFFGRVAEECADIAEVYVGFSDKSIVFGSGFIPPVGYDPTVRPWYTSALKANGDIVFSEPYIDIVTGKMVITIAQYSGKVKGLDAVYGLDLFVDTVTNEVAGIKLPEGGDAFLIDTNGLIVAHQIQAYAPSVQDGLKSMENFPIYKDIYNRLKTTSNADIFKTTNYDNVVCYFTSANIESTG